jgi:hypothetical protein
MLKQVHWTKREIVCTWDSSTKALSSTASISVFAQMARYEHERIIRRFDIRGSLLVEYASYMIIKSFLDRHIVIERPVLPMDVIRDDGSSVFITYHVAPLKYLVANYILRRQEQEQQQPHEEKLDMSNLPLDLYDFLCIE